MSKESLLWARGQKLISAQGREAVVHQRVLDLDTNEAFYRIQFAPYNEPAQMYFPHMAYVCFYKRED